ncbi:MAG: hypothetical protein LUO79_06530, partial [Methanomassiliicoccales archaeon]|nr:hypothetical protein [Methanomassiliicoccales archaeon]
MKPGTEGRSEIRGIYLVLLSVAGMVLSFASSAGRQIEWLQPDVLFGLYGALPILYWIGIAITAVSLLLGLRSKNEWVFSVQFLVLYVTLWSAPALFERYPSVWDSYMHFFSVQSVAQTGSSLAQGALSYTANYPGFFVVNGVFVLLGNPPVLGFLSFYPVVVSAITFVALYLFVRTYVSGLDFRLAMIICALANVWVQFSFSPQSLG